MAIGIRCTPCQQTDSPCAVERNGDRRKSGSRGHIETLEQRILELEGLHSRMMQNREQSGVSREEEARSDGVALPASYATQTGTPDVTPLYALPLSTPDLSLVESLPALKNDYTSASTLVELCTASGKESSGQASGVVGSTSQYHTRSTGMTQPYHQRHIHPYMKKGYPEDLEIATGTNAVRSKRQLLQSFFKYQPLWVAAVDEELFWEHRANRESSMWYSSFLEAVMLASATRLSDSSALRSIGEQSYNQAKAGIVQALYNSSAASMQGFLMLSEYEVSQGREIMGWQLCGKK
jgi:hypothetical protein